jgi:hypothetical protein
MVVDRLRVLRTVCSWCEGDDRGTRMLPTHREGDSNRCSGPVKGEVQCAPHVEAPHHEHQPPPQRLRRSLPRPRQRAT